RGWKINIPFMANLQRPHIATLTRLISGHVPSPLEHSRKASLLGDDPSLRPPMSLRAQGAYSVPNRLNVESHTRVFIIAWYAPIVLSFPRNINCTSIKHSALEILAAWTCQAGSYLVIS